jgi:hypothetical protein
MKSQRDHPRTRPNFDVPIEIVADPSLSKQEKARRWDLEQEARQLGETLGHGRATDRLFRGRGGSGSRHSEDLALETSDRRRD